MPPANQRWRHEFDALFTAQGIEPPQPVATSNSASYLKALLRRGGYLSFPPRQTIGDPAEEGLVAITVDVPAMRPGIMLTTRDRVAASPPRRLAAGGRWPVAGGRWRVAGGGWPSGCRCCGAWRGSCR